MPVACMYSADATHSRNIAVRPQIGIVVFDSQVPISTGQAVYMTAVAGQPTGAELERGIDVYSPRSLADGSLNHRLQFLILGLRRHVELAGMHAFQECVPFCGCELQYDSVLTLRV